MINNKIKKLILNFFEFIFMFFSLIILSGLTFILGDFFLRLLWTFLYKKETKKSKKYFKMSYQLLIDSVKRNFSLFFLIPENIKIILLIIFFLISIYIYIKEFK